MDYKAPPSQKAQGSRGGPWAWRRRSLLIARGGKILRNCHDYKPKMAPVVGDEERQEGNDNVWGENRGAHPGAAVRSNWKWMIERAWGMRG